jgi:hypothetical protein
MEMKHTRKIAYKSLLQLGELPQVTQLWNYQTDQEMNPYQQSKSPCALCPTTQY